MAFFLALIKLKNMYNIKVIVLDFDNCIALNEKTGEGSEDIKDRAWYTVFSDIKPDLLLPVIEEAKNRVRGGKGDRWDIIKIVLTHFGKDVSEEEIWQRSKAFNDIVQSGIANLPIWEDRRKFLGWLSSVWPLYLNTGTTREAILQTLQSLKLSPFFKGVYSRPGTKVSNLREIIAAEKIVPAELVFVDDDHHPALEAAEIVGCRFIGVQTKRFRRHIDVANRFPSINSVYELPKFLNMRAGDMSGLARLL